MIFEHNEKTKELLARLEAFMDKYVYPNEETYTAQMKPLAIIAGKCQPFLKS